MFFAYNFRRVENVLQLNVSELHLDSIISQRKCVKCIALTFHCNLRTVVCATIRLHRNLILKQTRITYNLRQM